MKRVTSKKSNEKSSKRKGKGRHSSEKLLDLTSSQEAKSNRKSDKGGPGNHESGKKDSSKESCENCSRDLSHTERALFVEEEIGRIFCSESCIAAYFSPEISRLEKEYYRRLSPSDLTSEEKDRFSHLRWMTLQEPDEVWREKTLTGDYRYTLISEYQPENRTIWSICICLFLRGEPSFLFMAFQTKNASMTAFYRKGERIEWMNHQNLRSNSGEESSSIQSSAPVLMDGLADAWTQEETERAQVMQKRRQDDVPLSDFVLYEGCVDETLEAPDEVWSLQSIEENDYQVYHFMRYYPEEVPGIWYVVIARETEDAGQIEILETFPTRDASLVERYRRGHQEIGQPVEPMSSRIVH